ncbi:hypothetical protein Trydic_g13576 [Trypoxylus dichotomus]
MSSALIRIIQVLLLIFCQIRDTFYSDLLLLHNNNINFHFEEEVDETGGAGRALYLLNKFREDAQKGVGPPVLYLNAGDNFSHTRSYTAHQWELIADFLNLLKPDAMCLGNHDLYLGIKNLTRFLERLLVPVITCNIDVGVSNVLRKYIRPSRILEINNHKVGIVGITTSKVNQKLLPETMSIRDEIESVRKECYILHDLGVDIIIVLSHAGEMVDEVMARVVDHIDVVVGCGMYENLYSKSRKVVRNKDGRYVPIIREQGFMRSLGMLEIQFNEVGEIVKYNGVPILLHSKIPQDENTLKLRKRIKRSSSKADLGRAMVTLNARCSKRECNFGNLIADALIDNKAADYNLHGKKPWSDFPIAMVSAGMVLRNLKRGTSLTTENFQQCLMYDDTIVYIKIRGRYIRRALLEGTLTYGRSTGYFFQFSGLRVRYNLTKPITERITRLFARCGICKVPEYLELDDRSLEYIKARSIKQGTFGYDSADNLNDIRIANDQKQRLLDNSERMERSGKRLEEGYRVVLGTQDIGTQVLQNLKNEKQTGGAGRALHILTKARQKATQKTGPPVLYLNAGDNFVGPGLYQEYRWRIVADFLNILKPDVMCLGNHDFDEGPTNLTKFLRRITFPVVGANVQVHKEKRLLGLVKPYHIFSIGNWTIGVIGYTTRRTKVTSRAAKIEFTDEVAAVARESERLRRMGVQIIVALGHAGLAVDERIAKVVEEVDIIVGAHRQSWSWNIQHVASYPPEIRLRKDGKKVLILYEPGYLQFLGTVRITFDEDGDVEKYAGQPIYLHSKIPEAKATFDLITTRKKREDSSPILGKTRVSLSGACLIHECNMANILLDAMVDHLATKFRSNKAITERWTSYPIAVINGGAFRKTFNISLVGKNITEKVILDLIPFNDVLCTLDIMGRYLQQALEQAVTWKGRLKGELLQVSGLHVTYNFSRPKGERISRIYARCGGCRIPRYHRLKPDEMYSVVTSYYVAEGLSGHTGISINKRNYIKRNVELQSVFRNYVTRYKVVFADIEDRLQMTSESWRSGMVIKLAVLSCIVIEMFKKQIFRVSHSTNVLSTYLHQTVSIPRLSKCSMKRLATTGLNELLVATPSVCS